MANDQTTEDPLKKLFVGGLNRSTPDETLRSYFESYGEMTDCVVIRDQEKNSRGFGYVTFAEKDSVLKVLKEKPHKIDGKDVEVKRAIPRNEDSATAHHRTKKIFIGGLKDEATKEDISQVIADAVRGISPTSVDLIMKKEDPTKHRGFCFVEFDDEDIVDELCCIKKVNVAGKDVEIKKAQPKDQGQGGGRGGRGGRGGGGGRGGYSSRDRSGGGGGYGGYNPYGGQASGYHQQPYADPSYGYGYDPYQGGYDNGYGAMGSYQQGPSSYGPQHGNYRGGGGARQYKPY